MNPHKLLHKLTDPMHNWLSFRVKWYESWHKNPYHKHVHLGTLAIYIVTVATFVSSFLPYLNNHVNAAASFQANYNSGSLDANFSLGSSTASTDTALPVLNPAGYGGTNSLSYSYDGTSTLKYPTASNLPADKGSVEMKFQKSAYGDAVDQDVSSMYNPSGISYDSSTGYIYIADSGNDRIIKTKIDGTGWQTLGSNGSGTGKFNTPSALTYDAASGFLYIFDSCNGRIVKTKMDGSGWTVKTGFSTSNCTYGLKGNPAYWNYFVGSRGIYYDANTDYIYATDTANNQIIKTKIDGTGWIALGGFSSPSGIFYNASDSNIYVTNSGANNFVKTQINGSGWATLAGLVNASGLQFDSPSGYLYTVNSGATLFRTKFDGSGQATLAGFSAARNIYYDTSSQYFYAANMTPNNIIKTQFDGTGWTAYGSYGNNLMKISRPMGTYYDSASGYYYIADYGYNRIIKTKIDGTGWQTLGGPVAGALAGQFNAPVGIAYDTSTGYIYIADKGNTRIVKTKIDGSSWATFSVAALCTGQVPNSLGFNQATGQLFFGSYNNTCLARVSTDFQSSRNYSGIVSTYNQITYDNINDWIYWIGNTNKVYRMHYDGTSIDSFGSAGSGVGQFSAQPWIGASQITIDLATQYIYVADMNNNRIVRTDWGANSWATYGATGSGVGQFSSPNSVQYDAATGYIYISDSVNNRVVHTKIDGTGWQTTNDFTSKEKVLYSAQATDDSRLVYDVASRKLRFYLAYSNKAQFVETPTLNLTDGNWYTVKASFNKAAHTLAIDLDGVNQATATYDTDWGSLSYGTSFYIGARNGSTTDRWDGMIDDVNVNIESVDAVIPTNPTGANTHFYADSSKSTSFTSDSWGNSATPYITWSGASDTDSGLKGYYAYFGTDSTAEPNSTSGLLTPNDGAKLFKTHVGADGAEQNVTVPANVLTTGVTYYLILRTQDNDLNTADKASLFIYKYDGGAPAPPEFINASPAGCSTASTFTFSWDAITDPVSGIAGYEYKNGSNGTVQQIADVSTLEKAPYQEGDNIIYIRTKDNAGNVSTWQTAVYCSTGIAYIIDGPKVVAGPSSITVNWVSNKPTTSSVKVYEGNTYISEQGQTSFDINHTVKVIGLKPEKAYRYKLTWSDQTANIAESEWYETTTTVAPKVIDLKAEVLTPNKVAVSWKTDTAAVAEIDYGISNYNTIIKIDGNNTTFSSNLDSLTGGSTYQLMVLCSVADGTEFRSGITFQTPPVPIISGLRFEPLTDRSQPASRVTWTTNVETTSTLYYGVKDGAKAEITKSDKTREHEMLLENLVDNTNYEAYVSGSDSYGNSTESDVNSFQTAQDTRPPTISNITIETSNVGLSNNNKAQAIIGYKTDEAARCSIDYGQGISGSNYSGKTNQDEASSLNHLSIISGLKPQTPYHIKITCLDKSENRAESADQTVISGEVTQSVFNIIINTLNNLFGWLGKLVN